MDVIEGAKAALVSGIEKKKRTVRPPAPFNTTSLMAAAAAEGISPARTMRIAESLYMDGYISYPRVDNTVYPSSLNLVDVVRTLSGNPAYSDYCNKLQLLAVYENLMEFAVNTTYVEKAREGLDRMAATRTGQSTPAYGSSNGVTK